ncbi:TIGR03620 family F420-dependent LLM class oxidoreductase [Kineococcus aurantiacus]|uniref:Putative F420-dependent oxidoreductase n=1 Tax=Kineococcus aurantiacus TaxID=37633 RepID=A0A7Y9DLT9_9ACTN|nr:putative F420-dependent oxidoreductase [Kineococcus aurantiacus]
MSEPLISLWGGGPWQDPARAAEAREVAAELEELGFHRLWFSGGFGDGVLPAFGELLAATRTLGVASGIVSIWTATPEQSARAFAELEAAHPGRFLLGLGNSHAPAVEGRGGRYDKPYSRTVDYLDALGGRVPRERLVLAALGPRMLELARERTLGAHPYFVTPEHTALAREALGEGSWLAPEVAVVLDADAAGARATAREHLATYLQLPNYTNNLRRLGWGDDDLLHGGSDRLVDALVPWGPQERVAAGVRRHVEAGADEVAVQVLGGRGDFPRAAFRELAAALV